MQKRNLFVGLLAIGMAACGGANKSKMQSADKGQGSKDFVSLLQTNSMQGWHKFNGGAPGSDWQVSEGVLHFKPTVKEGWQTKNGGDIVTDEVFGHFHLSLEWKVSPGANSGIMFLIKEDPKYTHAWRTGPEMQVLDNERHADARITKHRAGDLYDLISCSRETAKPAGEWNHAEVIFTGNQLQLRLNGETVVTTSYGDAAWRALVAGSKFKDMPDFGTFSSGRIGLQDHGDEVWFRNIRIKKLP